MHLVDQLTTQTEGAGYHIYTNTNIGGEAFGRGNAYNWNHSKKS